VRRRASVLDAPGRAGFRFSIHGQIAWSVESMREIFNARTQRKPGQSQRKDSELQPRTTRSQNPYFFFVLFVSFVVKMGFSDGANSEVASR